MWSSNKKDRCLKSSLLFLNFAACVAIVYIYLRYTGEPEKSNFSFEGLIQPEKLSSENCTPVCVSRGCMWHANMFLKQVDSTVAPCDDFHSFLCSGFQRKFDPDENANLIIETTKLMMNILKGIVDNVEGEPGSASAKMKTVYDSCVNYGSSELQGIRELKNFFSDIGLSNWPHLPQDFHFDDVKLSAILAKFLAYGTKHYVAIQRVTGNDTQEDYIKVTFYRYTFNRTSTIARELAVSMLKYFDLEEEDIDMIITDAEHVKDSIINLHETHGECREEECEEVQIDCSKQSDEDWNDLCETLRLMLHPMVTNDPVNTNLIKLDVPEDSFFKNLFPLLHSFSNRSLANFIGLNFLKEYQSELNFYFRLSKLKNNDFEFVTLKEFYELDRWKYCVKWIADNMKLSLENEFLHQYLRNPVTEQIIKIYNDFYSDIIELITLQEWIPTEEKSFLTEKLQNVSFNIELLGKVFPNDTYVDNYYEKFVPTSESFFENVLRLRTLKLILPSSRRNFHDEDFSPHMTDFEVQATAGGSSLDIHFGMLIPPFYIPGHLNLFNRLVLAPIIGHEFGHFIFSSLAHKLGEDKTFLDKRQCLGDQFSKFKFENLDEYLNGSIYDSENFPDNIAVTVIDKAIEKYFTSEDILLPGLPYSTKQLLYMSSVQIWCAKNNLERDIQHKTIDPHAPTKFRLIGMMQNSRGYSEAFQCPAGSFMNPAAKCSFLDTN